MPAPLHRITERIEARWGLPVPDLLRDFAAQGLSQQKTAAALGMYSRTLRKLLAAHGLRALFPAYTPPAPDCKDWIDRVEREAGQPIDAVLRQEARSAAITGTTMAELAAELETPAFRVRVLCKTLGIQWPHIARRGR